MEEWEFGRATNYILGFEGGGAGGLESLLGEGLGRIG